MTLNELSYAGNLGMMEMIKFHKLATPEQKAKMKELISTKRTKEAWDLLKQVSGVALQDK